MHKNRYFGKKNTNDNPGEKKTNNPKSAELQSNGAPCGHLWSPVLLYCVQLFLNTSGDLTGVRNKNSCKFI